MWSALLLVVYLLLVCLPGRSLAMGLNVTICRQICQLLICFTNNGNEPGISVNEEQGGMHKFSLGSIKDHAMKTYRRIKVQLHVFLILALDRVEWLASSPSCFSPR